MKIYIVYSNPESFMKVRDALEGCNGKHSPEDTTIDLPSFELQEKKNVFTDNDLRHLLNDFGLWVTFPPDYKDSRVLYVDTIHRLV